MELCAHMHASGPHADAVATLHKKPADTHYSTKSCRRRLTHLLHSLNAGLRYLVWSAL
jgi:hypothetical protein